MSPVIYSLARIMARYVSHAKFLFLVLFGGSLCYNDAIRGIVQRRKDPNIHFGSCCCFSVEQWVECSRTGKVP